MEIIFILGAVFYFLWHSRRKAQEKERLDALRRSLLIPSSAERRPAGHPLRDSGTLSQASISWIPPGKSVVITKVEISDGMIYMGQTNSDHSMYYRQSHPSVIDPSKPVASYFPNSTNDLGYWPSYSGMSPEQRRAYLTWLSAGRSSPVDIGYVFVFFYGLERRLLEDHTRKPLEDSEYRLLIGELMRLVDLYGDSSSSFSAYAIRLLDFLNSDELPSLPSDIVPLIKRSDVISVKSFL